MTKKDTEILGIQIDSERKYNMLTKFLGLPNTGTTFEAYKERVLSAESMTELLKLRKEYSSAEHLSELQKTMLSELARARYGNYIQL